MQKKNIKLTTEYPLELNDVIIHIKFIIGQKKNALFLFRLINEVDNSNY